MPLYSFQCLMCNRVFDEVYRVHDCPQERKCVDPKCRGTAIKIIATRGAVLSDTPSWLEDPMVQGALEDIDSGHFHPIETRGQLKQIMKKRGICEAPGAGPRWI
jgi:putative FmdB family regulatory protein